MYNDTNFSRDVVNMSDSKQNQPTNDIEKKTFSEYTAEVALPANTLFKSSGNLMPPHETQITSQVLPSDHNSIQLSKDKLFFVKFTPDRTMRPRWYLIQVDLQDTMDINPLMINKGRYWCIFLAKHPGDNVKSDEFSRWWPEWYRYTRCKTTQTIVYGDRILVRPNSNPDSSKFIQWATDLKLIGKERKTVSLDPSTLNK